MHMKIVNFHSYLHLTEKPFDRMTSNIKQLINYLFHVGFYSLTTDNLLSHGVHCSLKTYLADVFLFPHNMLFFVSDTSLGC